MKKYVFCAAALFIALCFAGCTGANTAASLPAMSFPEASTVSGESSSVSTVPLEDIETPDDADYEDNLNGLCSFLKDAYAIVESDGDTSNRTELLYDMIGASGGVRYSFTLNGHNVVVELYEFSAENSGENAATAETVLKSIEETGKFTVLDKELEGYLSDNGKYMMVYTDADKSELNVAQKERVISLFKGFKA